MNPRITCYVIGVEVTHMLGDGRVGVHHSNCDSVKSMELCSHITCYLPRISRVLKKLELWFMLEIMLRLHAGTVRTHRGCVACWIICLICNYVLSHNYHLHIISQSMLPFIDTSYHHCLVWLLWYLWARETGEIDDYVRPRAWLWGYLWDRDARRSMLYWFMPWLAYYSAWTGSAPSDWLTSSEHKYLLSASASVESECRAIVRIEWLWGMSDCEDWGNARTEWSDTLRICIWFYHCPALWLAYIIDT